MIINSIKINHSDASQDNNDIGHGDHDGCNRIGGCGDDDGCGGDDDGGGDGGGSGGDGKLFETI